MPHISFSVADIRVGPKFRSERDSQLIYGEEVKVLGEKDDYLYVEGADRLKGYVLRTLVGESGPKEYKIRFPVRTKKMIFPFGSYVSSREVADFGIPEDSLMSLKGELSPLVSCHEFLSVPYLWGGTSDLGYDCSGFVQRLYRFNNIEIPRNADWQRDNTRAVESFGEAEPGDLVFFEGHVGLYIGEDTIIHANLHNGGVSYTDLKDGSEYSRTLMGIFERIGRVDPAAISLPY